MIVTKKDITETLQENGLWDNIRKKKKRLGKKYKPAKPGDEDYSNKKGWDKAVDSSNEGLTLEVIDELFSIHEECDNPSFYISKKLEDFGKPMMEKSDDCYQVSVNPGYKDLSFVFEVIQDMYENNEFTPMLSESNVICEECFELKIEKRLTENIDKWLTRSQISEALQYHLNNNISLLENVYRPGSPKHAMIIKETRELWESGALKISELSVKLFENTDLGKFDLYEGAMVALDLPFTVDMTEEELLAEAKYQGKDVELGKPKRGGSKKFYVYVRKPGGGVKKVSFGDTTGLSVKLNNPAARKAFAARHDCANKKDRTKASYWSCRLPRYASLLGLKSKFGGYW
jgi:hypothetical protein